MNRTGGDGEQASRAAGPFSLIADPTFRKLWIIGVLMGAMRWLEMLAIGVWVLELTGSAFVVALMTMLRMLPLALFGSVTGAVADRLDRKLLLILSVGLMAAVAGVLSLSAWMGTLTVWQVAVGAFLSGVGWSTDFPVRRTILGESVGRGRLGAAMSLDSASNNATRVIGPFAGGGLYVWVGMEGVYALAFAVYALTTLLAVMVVYRPAGGAPRALTLLSEIREGLRYVRQSRALMGHLGITVIFNLFGFPYAAMVPVVGQQTFNANPVAIGLLQSIEGAGAFVGAMSIAFLASPTRFRLIYLWGTVLFLVCILLFSLTTSYPVAMVTLMASGFGLSGFAAMQSAIMFSEAPPEIRSRLMGILSVCIGVGPIGVLHVGWLAEHLGGSLALTVMSAEGLIALAVLVFLVPEVRR